MRTDDRNQRVLGLLPRCLAVTGLVLLLAACATPTMQAQWRDPQFGDKALHSRTVLVVCRGLDLTLDRICEDRLAADMQAIGAKVVRAEVAREAPAEPDAAAESLLKAARAVRADAVLAMTLERSRTLPAPAGGTVGIGVGGVGGRIGGGIGIALPIGGARGPALAASTRLIDAASGRLVWSGRARGSGAVSEVDQVGEVSRVTTAALKDAGLF